MPLTYTPLADEGAATALTAYDWARLALTGDAQQSATEPKTPTDEQLTPFIISETLTLQSLYPCLTLIADASEPDKDAFAEAVGLRVAGRVRNSPLWSLLGLEDDAEVKIGPITMKPKGASAATLLAAYSAGESAALNRISCIIAARLSTPARVIGILPTRGVYSGRCRR